MHSDGDGDGVDLVVVRPGRERSGFVDEFGVPRVFDEEDLAFSAIHGRAFVTLSPFIFTPLKARPRVEGCFVSVRVCSWLNP